MASAFQKQLAAIAQTQTNELDLRARRKAHAESLIFEKDVAIKQNWDTIYTICLAGFVDLCSLDPRFDAFSRDLFAPDSKDQDREQLNKSQNELLDQKLEQCLELLSGRLMLRPGARALEWLVRRFQVHKYNVSALLQCALSWHEEKIFQNVLALVPENLLKDEWKFLRPYHSVGQAVPRHAIVYAATNNDGFFVMINAYATNICQIGVEYQQFMRWWGSLAVESLAGRLNQAKSGRRELQRQRTEDILRMVLPVLHDGFEAKDCAEMIITCYTLSIVLASTDLLEDHVLDKMMETIVQTIDHKDIQLRQTVVTLSVLLQHKSERRPPSSVTKSLIAGNRIKELMSVLDTLKAEHNTLPLVHGLFLSLLTIESNKDVDQRIEAVEVIFANFHFLATAPNQYQILEIIAACIGSADLPINTTVRARAIQLLQQLYESGNHDEALAAVAQNLEEKGLTLQDLLQTYIPLPSRPTPQEEEVDPDTLMEESDDLEQIIDALPNELPKIDTFFSHPADECFAQLIETLRRCNQLDGGLQRFRDLEVWQQSSDSRLLYIQFILAASVSHDSRCSVPALELLTLDVEQASSIDTQELLPYVTLGLRSHEGKVRKAASNLILAMDNKAPISSAEDETCQKLEILSTASEPTSFLSSHLSKILKHTYLPTLEECVGDAEQIRLVITHVLNGSSTRQPEGLKKTDVEMKKALRQDLFRCMLSHLSRVPSWNIKADLFELLVDVERIGTASKSETLLPLFKSWVEMSREQVRQISEDGALTASRIDRAICTIMSAENSDSVDRVFNILEKQNTTPREDLLEAIFGRLQTIWKNVPQEAQPSLVTRLFDMSFNTNTGLARFPRATLQQLRCSTPTLLALINHATKIITDMPQEGPPRKKRRTSRDYEFQDQASAALVPILPKLALVLEVIDGAQPESRPELMPMLFEVLTMLSKLRRSQQTESPYVLNLCMTNILAITNKAQTARRPNIDVHTIRVDVVTEIVRTADNPQVQLTALQLASTLAMLIPEKIIHNLMPVFTFNNSQLVSKDDEHSINVIHQAIDEVIPPLVTAFRKQNPNNVVLAAKDILSTFAAAYDHISQPRRLKLYQRLLLRLGPEDFAYALVAVLATRQEDNTLGKFFQELMTEFNPLVVLITCGKLVGLTSGMFSGQTLEADALLNLNKYTSAEESENSALKLYATAEELLRNRQLLSTISKQTRSDPEAASYVLERLRACLHQALRLVRDQNGVSARIALSARTYMTALLELLPPAQLMSSAISLLDEMTDAEQDLKPQVLRVVAARLQSKAPTDGETVEVAFTMLDRLKTILAETDNTDLQLTCLLCIDQVSQSYGRKNVEALVDVARLLSSNILIDHEKHVTIAAILTLASIMDIIGEAAVPITPVLLKNVFYCFEQCFVSDKEDEQLHNASLALLSALVSNVAFMVSDDDLDRVFDLSAQAASSNLPATSIEARKDFFSVTARKIEFSSLVSSLKRTWLMIVDNGEEAVIPAVELLSSAIGHHSKSTVAASSELTSNLIVQMLDLRRLQVMNQSEDSYSMDDIAMVESHLNELTLAFIYKLNDAIFRPIFESWIDWATTCSDVSHDVSLAQLHRQTSLLSLLNHFFTNLKSIVTSYAAFILPMATTILNTTYESSEERQSSSQLNLYTSLLTTLTTCFTHDADAFFASPSLFKPLCSSLTTHVQLAASKPLRPLISNTLIPCLVALATAVQDTPAHHLAINHALVQLRHHESAHVRLASIRTHIAITEHEDVGEEWVSNVVSGAAAEIDAGDDEADGDLRGNKKAVVIGGSGETMIYVNEMLEDDDEAVEAEVRRWVRMVREMVGEDVFEF